MSFIADEQADAAAVAESSFVADTFVPEQVDNSDMKAFVKDNIAKKKAERQTVDTSVKPVEAEDWVDSLAAGWGMSVTGLLGGKPTMTMPEQTESVMEIANIVGTMAGDIPFMITGGLAGTMLGAPAGGAVGTAVAGPAGTIPGIVAGAPIGAMAGANALPAGMRKVLMDHYERGDINTAKEFWNRLSGATWETLKAGTAGAVAGQVGKFVGPVAGNLARDVSEISTMVTVGAALEGQMPDAKDILNASVIVGGISGVRYTAGKFRNIYAKTGEMPSTVLDNASQDVIVKQDILSANPDAPIPVGDTKPLPRTKMESAKALFKGLMDDEGTSRIEDIPRFEEIKQVTKENWDRFYQKAIYSLDPVKSLVDDIAEGREIPNSANPEMLMRNFADYQGKVLQAIDKKGGGTLDFNTGKFNGKSLGSILKEVFKGDDDMSLTESESKVIGRVAEGDRSNKGKTWGKFVSYLMAKRAIEKEAQGVKTGIDLDAAHEVVSTNKARFEAHAKELHDFQKRMLKYAYDAGVVSKKSYEAMVKANEDYIPFHRLFEDGEAKKGGKTGKSLKQMVGSEREILDPIMAIHKNTEVIYRIAEENRAVKAMVEMAEKSPKGEKYLTKVKGKVKPIDVKDTEVQAFLRKHGFDDADIPDEGFTIFRGLRKDLEENQFAVFRDGVREVYETSPEIAEAIRGLGNNAGMNNVLFKIAKGTAGVLRAGVTLNPDFIVRNPVRDQFTSGLQSKFKTIPFVDTLINIGEVMGKSSPAWQEFVASGGATGSFAEVARHIDQNTWGTLKKTGHLNQVWNVVKTPIDFLAAASEVAENMTRFTEFKKGGGIGGTLDQKVGAAFAAREVTVDFSRAGASILLRNYSKLTPFFNVGIQGTDRMIRAFGENPKRFTTMAVATITIPSVLLWMRNRNDSRVQGAPNWENDIFWKVPTDWWQKPVNMADVMSRPDDLKRQLPDGTWEVNNGIVMKIPKPFLPGILFGTLVERSLDQFVLEKPDAFNDMVQSLWDSLRPNMTPAIAAAPLEHIANRSFFTGNQVVPEQQQRYMPEYRYTEYNSETAKIIGKLIGHIPWIKNWGPEEAPLQSPAVIDNYVQSWTGSGGKHLIKISDAALKVAGVGGDAGIDPPSWTAADIPVVGAFVSRWPRANMQNVLDFKKNYKETSQVVATVEMLAKSGDFQASIDLMKVQQEDFVKLNGFNTAINNQMKLIDQWNRSKELNGPDKRQLIDTAYYQMQQISILGNQMLASHRKNLKKYGQKRED